ncbi:MAG: type III PLP-dependent enzyme [Alphaproteobacteria bacterium]|nr:type III PLP-dependent enzyme [Alphaproteobacteria bacterium]
MDYNESVPIQTGATAGYASATEHAPAAAPGLPQFASIEAMVKAVQPAQPVHCLHPEKLVEAARTFIDHFPGHSLYAIKSNPDPYVLKRLHDAGITHFDVASLGEVRQVREMFPDAHLAFMNPVKSREAIRSAYYEYGVRDFVVDTRDEINKIVEETDRAADLLIVVRLGMPKGSAACQLTGKFGCLPDIAVELLKDAAKVAARVGLSFHVGSQTLDPASYANAIRMGSDVVRRSGVTLSVFDVGGGFPIPGLGMDIPPLTAFFDVIRDEIAALGLPEECEIWSEPGRALSGNCSTLVVRVELRKDDVLYINDGSYGNMFEVCSMSWKNATAAMRLPRAGTKGRRALSKTSALFRFYGPTCDSVDYLPGPFTLPDDINEGDYIALEGMGAYGSASQTSFNGFHSDTKVEIIPGVAATHTRRRNPRGAKHLKVVK